MVTCSFLCLSINFDQNTALSSAYIFYVGTMLNNFEFAIRHIKPKTVNQFVFEIFTNFFSKPLWVLSWNWAKYLSYKVSTGSHDVRRANKLSHGLPFYVFFYEDPLTPGLRVQGSSSVTMNIR